MSLEDKIIAWLRAHGQPASKMEVAEGIGCSNHRAGDRMNTMHVQKKLHITRAQRPQLYALGPGEDDVYVPLSRAERRKNAAPRTRNDWSPFKPQPVDSNPLWNVRFDPINEGENNGPTA